MRKNHVHVESLLRPTQNGCGSFSLVEDPLKSFDSHKLNQRQKIRRANTRSTDPNVEEILQSFNVDGSEDDIAHLDLSYLNQGQGNEEDSEEDAWVKQCELARRFCLTLCHCQRTSMCLWALARPTRVVKGAAQSSECSSEAGLFQCHSLEFSVGA